MIEITERAAREARALLDNLGRPGAAIRLLVREKGCNCSRYRMAVDDEARAGDRVLERGGVRFLLDPRSAELLAGAVVDFVEEGGGRGFVIQGAPEPGHDGDGCGCGHG